MNNNLVMYLNTIGEEVGKKHINNLRESVVKRKTKERICYVFAGQTLPSYQAKNGLEQTLKIENKIKSNK